MTTLNVEQRSFLNERRSRTSQTRDSRLQDRAVANRAFIPPEPRAATPPISHTRMWIGYGMTTTTLVAALVCWVTYWTRASTEPVPAAEVPQAAAVAPVESTDAKAMLITAGGANAAPIVPAYTPAKPKNEAPVVHAARTPAAAVQAPIVEPVKSKAPVAPILASIVNLPTKPWTQAGNYIGQMMTVEGTIMDAAVGSKAVILNFSKNGDGLYATISDSNIASFTTSPADAYVGKKIRVTGRIATVNDRPLIRINSPEQIVVVE